MGILSWRKAEGDRRNALPAGSFTINREGGVIASTVTSRFPEEQLAQVSQLVLKTFKEGRSAGLPLNEFVVKLGAIHLRAVEMRGGAMIFLSPQS